MVALRRKAHDHGRRSRGAAGFCNDHRPLICLILAREMSVIKPIIGIGSDVLRQKGERDRAFVFTTYVDSLRRAGAVPVLIPPQPENAAELIEDLDGIVLAGGDDCDPAVYGEAPHPSIEPMDPRRQANDLTLARIARESGIPTLGICLGVQVMNVAAGGTLIQDIASAVDTDIDHASE